MSVNCGVAHKLWHKEEDTTVVSRIAPGLQVLLGVAPLSPSDGASSHAQERLLGSPSIPMVSSTWRSTLSPHAMSPESLCLGVQDGALCLLTSPVQRRGLSPPEPLLPQGLLPRKGLGGPVGAGGHKPQGSGCLVCAHRPTGRMAWRLLVLLPFFLAAGEDFARQLAQVGRKPWRCFQPPTLVPNSLRAAGTTRTAAQPIGTLETQGNLAPPGQGRAGRGLGNGDGTQHGCCSWRSSMVWRWEVWDEHEEGEGWWVPLPPLETQTTVGSWGWS